MPARTGRQDHLTRNMNVRLTEREYRHVVAQATLAEVGLSESLRRALDRDIEAQPALGHGDGSPGESMSYDALLAAVDVEAALEQLREAGLAS